MADITMCSNNSCKLKNDCYRSSCMPSGYYQSFSKFEPYQDENKLRCDYQIKLIKKDEK